MSLRYMWSKWSVDITITGYKQSSTSSGASTYLSGSNDFPNIYTSFTFDTTTGKYTLSRTKRATYNATGYYTPEGYSSGYTMYYGTVTSADSGAIEGTSYYYYSSTLTASKKYTATDVTKNAKGSTQYDNVSGSQNAYSSNGVTGDYWYVLLGSDTIDPSDLTMTGEVKAGSTVTLTITPSATIAYGGTVSYTVQTTTDGDNWYDAGTTTDTTMSLTVPEAAAWNARVIASDDTGFTSTDYVYANGSEDLVSVINVGFVPSDGWIGYKNTKNLLIVSATGTDGETVNISASLDGTQVITGSTTSGVSYQLALTDEQFAAVTEGENHTLTVTAQYATSGTSETRTYTFRKFDYDDTSLRGVM